MIRSRIIVCVIAAVIGVLCIWVLVKPNRWRQYYQEKLNHPPREFVINALNAIPEPKGDAVALDLGCSVGHETLALLEKGYDVIAIDSQPEAFDIMLRRPEIQKFNGHIATIVSRFEKLDYAALPDLDLIVAAYALPFTSPDRFEVKA